MKLLHLSGGTENPSKASISTVSVPPEVRNWHLSNTSQKCYHYNIYFLTYLLTPWCRVLLEKPTSMQLVKKFPAFHGTWRFITALISICHLSLSWASLIHSIYPHPTSWRSIVILSTHLCLGLPSGLFPSGVPNKTLTQRTPQHITGTSCLLDRKIYVRRWYAHNCLHALTTTICYRILSYEYQQYDTYTTILILKANEMHYFSNLFHKVLYMFRTCPLSIISSISTLYTLSRYLSF